MSDSDDARSRRDRVAGPPGGGFSGRPRIRRGDRVSVVATGFACRPEKLHRGVRALAALGFDPVIGEHVADVAGYLAGDDAARLADLNAALRDPTVRGIWFARGGYGTARLLPKVDWRALRRDPKVLIGYSDLTALFLPALDRTRALCVHGPVVTELGDRRTWHRPSLAAALSGRPIVMRVPRRAIVAPGRASGRLVGGNLTVMTHLVGTPYFPDLSGSVLMIEETGEEAYRVDRLLAHLVLAGAFSRLAAVLIGSVAAPATKRSFPPDRRVADVLAERFGALGVPVVSALPFGHEGGQWSLPLGARAIVDANRGTVRIAGPAPRRT